MTIGHILLTAYLNHDTFLLQQEQQKEMHFLKNPVIQYKILREQSLSMAHTGVEDIFYKIL